VNGQRRDFFVTGTDTGVGKTLAAASLLRAWRTRGLSVAGMKPVASGAVRTPDGLRNSDALVLAAEGSHAWPYETINPYAFEPPIAPHLAAIEAGVEIRLGPIGQALSRLREGSDVVVVEGAGGFLVPLATGRSFADLPAEFGLEVILVVGLRLGCLSHAFLTAEAIAARGLPFAGWVGNRIDQGFDRSEECLRCLEAGLPVACLGVMPHMSSPQPGRLPTTLWRLPAVVARPA